MSNSSSIVVLLYRQLLKFSNYFNKPQKQEYLNEIKKEFRKHQNLTEKSLIEEKIQLAQSKLGFLKFNAPFRILSKQETGKFTVQNGKVVNEPAPKKGRRDYIDPRIDQDQINRHNYLLQRQHFGKK